MHLVFKQIDDKKADELLMSIAKRYNVRIDESSKKDEEIMKTKKKYTKKQIAEAIAYWKKQLVESTWNNKFVNKSELLQQYDIDIKRFGGECITSIITGIDPDIDFSSSLPWSLVVADYIVGCCKKFMEKNKKKVSIHSIEFGKNPGANVSF